MPAIAHAYRRGATYSWRRRIPSRLAPFCRAGQLVVCLGTSDPFRARYLASHLTAHSHTLFRRAMDDPDLVISRRQLDGVFRESLLAHLDKLDRVAATERREVAFDPEESRRADRRMGWVLRLLGARGAAATIDNAIADQMRREGLNEVDIEEARATLETIIAQRGHLMPRARLEALLEAQAAPATSVNLSLAQEAAFRAMSAAAFATERRYDGIRAEESDHVEAIVRSEVGRMVGWQAEPIKVRPSMEGQRSGRDEASDKMEIARSGEAKPATIEPASPPITKRPPAKIARDQHPVVVFGEAMIAARTRDGTWDEKTCRQARQIFALFAKLLLENELVEIGDLRQSHFAELVGLLRSVSPSYGKSPKDGERSTDELRAIGAELPPDRRGIAGETLNRHLTFLGQLITYLRAQGLQLDSGIDLSLLRARRRNRARNQRAALTGTDVAAIFRLPCFTGCKSWHEPLQPGPEVFHRALYFAIIMLHYTGARREEICGLQVEDVSEMGGLSYIAVRPNGTRRLKNFQSVRLIALHPEVIRLGFLDYVSSIRALNYRLVFPDLHSPNNRAPLGDRLYDEFIQGLKVAVPDASKRKKVLHSFRHSFGNHLKQAKVHTEIRADILGHAGAGETDERYCDPIALEVMLEQLTKLPVLTAHLERVPLKLLPWVAAREQPPFMRPSRRRRS